MRNAINKVLGKSKNEISSENEETVSVTKSLPNNGLEIIVSAWMDAGAPGLIETTALSVKTQIETLNYTPYAEWGKNDLLALFVYLRTQIEQRYLPWHEFQIQRPLYTLPLGEALAKCPEEDLIAHLEDPQDPYKDRVPYLDSAKVWDLVQKAHLHRFNTPLPPRISLGNVGSLLQAIMDITEDLAKEPGSIIFGLLLRAAPVYITPQAAAEVSRLRFPEHTSWAKFLFWGATGPLLPKPWVFPIQSNQIDRLLDAMYESETPLGEAVAFIQDNLYITPKARRALLTYLKSAPTILEVPLIEVPQIEAPKAETLKTKIPKIEAPKVEVPKIR